MNDSEIQSARQSWANNLNVVKAPITKEVVYGLELLSPDGQTVRAIGLGFKEGTLVFWDKQVNVLTGETVSESLEEPTPYASLKRMMEILKLDSETEVAHFLEIHSDVVVQFDWHLRLAANWGRDKPQNDPIITSEGVQSEESTFLSLPIIRDLFEKVDDAKQ